MARSGQRGFTLIELMIATAIVAILAAIGYPSYVNHVRKSVRRAAQAQMIDLASREQQFLLANRAYVPYSATAPDPSITGTGYVLPSELQGKYTPDITVGAGTVPSFTITFTATGSQANDGSLTLNDQGVKGCGADCDPLTKW